MPDWSEDLCLQLIELYKQNEILWDASNKEYMKKNVRDDGWRAISLEIGKPAEECKTKMENLKASWRRELKKVVKTTTGQGADEVYTSKWFAFKAFEFLIGRNKPRKTINSEDSTVFTLPEEETNSEIVDDPQKNEPAGSSTSNKAFIAPTSKQNTRKKMKLEEDPVMSGAYNILKTAAENMKTLPLEMDEVSSFFNFVMAKMKNYSPETKRAVQHAIFEITMKADTGYYEPTEMQTHYGYPTHYPDPRYSQSFTNQPASFFQTSSARVSSAPYVSPALSPSPSPSLTPSPTPSLYSTASSPSPGNMALNMSSQLHDFTDL